MKLDGDHAPERPASSDRSPDPRPARTKAEIFAAVDRLSEVSPSDVTVAAIARNAGISRSAFYTQFAGLEELLSAIVSQTAEQFGSVARNSVNADSGVDRRHMARASLSGLVDHVNAHIAFYSAAMSWKVSLSVHDATTAAYAAQIRELIGAVRERAPTDIRLPEPTEIDLIAQYVAGGLAAAVTAWLRSYRATPAPEFIEQLLALLPEWLTSEAQAKDSPPQPAIAAQIEASLGAEHVEMH